MHERVGIVGVGYEGFRPVVSDLSTRELMFEAAYKAYSDADIDPRKQVDSFISCTEDLWEGWSIADEMVPDQIGGALRAVCTVPADGVTGLGHAVMQVKSGVADVVALEAHSKVADVLDKNAVETLALDPTYLRPLGVSNDLLAGLEMSAFLHRTDFTREDCSDIVVESKRAAMDNPRASYGETLSREEVEKSEPLALPLRQLDKPRYAEAGVVLVLASERWIRRNRREAVYIDGVAWRSSTPWFEGGQVDKLGYARESFRHAAGRAGIKPRLSSFDVLEVDDSYSYKLLQHVYSLTSDPKEGRHILKNGAVALNPSGGSLGVGALLEASAMHRLLECVLQLRGTAGKVQVKAAEKAMVLSWRGFPTATGGTAILSN